MEQREASARAEARRTVGLAIVDAGGRVLRAAIFAAAAVGVAFMVRDPLIAMAGKTTALRMKGELDVAAEIPVDLTLDVNWYGTIALITSLFGNLMLGGIVIGVRRNADSTIRHLAARATRLEELLDPDRTSSGLTREGRTNPADR